MRRKHKRTNTYYQTEKQLRRKLINMLTIMVRGRPLLRRGPARPPAPPPDLHNSTTQKNPRENPHLPQRQQFETVREDDGEAQENKDILPNQKTTSRKAYQNVNDDGPRTCSLEEGPSRAPSASPKPSKQHHPENPRAKTPTSPSANRWKQE